MMVDSTEADEISNVYPMPLGELGKGQSRYTIRQKSFNIGVIED